MTGVPSVPDLSIAEVRARIAAGELSAVELAEAHLARIAAAEPLNVFRTVTAELALEQAAAVDAAAERGDPLGPLAGVPVSLKDNIEVAGVRMTAGTSVLRDNVADADAPVYERLRAAGAVLVGKLHMSEWAIGGTTQNIHFGDCHNPWDPRRVSGGSSGGSGAAISADLSLATLGTDTGGSVRLPASLNGCCGLRGTGGRVSNRGSIPVAWTFDAIGPLARRAEDVAAVMGVIAGYDPDDPASADVPVGDLGAELPLGAEGLRIGLLRGYWQDDLDAGVPCPPAGGGRDVRAARRDGRGDRAARATPRRSSGRRSCCWPRPRPTTVSGWPTRPRSLRPTCSPGCSAARR